MSKVTVFYGALEHLGGQRSEAPPVECQSSFARKTVVGCSRGGVPSSLGKERKRERKRERERDRRRGVLGVLVASGTPRGTYSRPREGATHRTDADLGVRPWTRGCIPLASKQASK